MRSLSRSIAPCVLVIVSLQPLSAQEPVLVGYWHNWDDASAPYMELDQIDPRYNVIEVAFAEPIAGTTYDMAFTPSGTSPATFAAQVLGHQSQGHKVLISIGGANATVQLNSDPERDAFVASMLSIIDAYGFDGIDLDLEGASVSLSGGTIAAPTDARILRLIEAVHAIADTFESSHGTPMMLTMAPETAFVQGGMSAFGGIWGAYLPVIDALRDRLDILQVQLYNSGSMYGVDGGIYTQGTADFIVSQTEAVIHGFTTGGGAFQGLPASKVAVALPACANAAGGGYTDTATVRMAMEYLLGEGPQPGSYALAQTGGYPSLRGMMTWSINWDAAAGCGGPYAFADTYERVFEELTTGVMTDAWIDFEVWPNPSSDFLYLEGVSDASRAYSIHDCSGRSLRTARLLPGMNRIDVSGLSSGTYLISLRDEQRSGRARFVKR